MKRAVLTVALTCAGCVDAPSPGTTNPEPAAVTRLSGDGAVFYTPRDCGKAQAYVPPEAGRKFTYALANDKGEIQPGVTREEAIGVVRGDVVEYGERIVTPDGQATPPEVRRIRAGVLPLSGPAMSIAYTADRRDPTTLSVGETETYPILYTASGQFGERAQDTTITVTFVNCRTIANGYGVISGEPVRVYRLVLPAVQAPPAVDELTATEFEWAVSERTGWRLVERSPAAVTFVTDMQ